MTTTEASISWIPELAIRLRRRASFGLRNEKGRSGDVSTGSKKTVRFCETESMAFESPAQPDELQPELWYTIKECNQQLWKDVDLLLLKRAQTSDPTARGLESYLKSKTEHNLTLHTRNQYRRAVTKQSRSTRKMLRIALVTKNRRGGKLDGISAYSMNATASSRDAAREVARRDEIEARMIYMEDSSELFTTSLP